MINISGLHYHIGRLIYSNFMYIMYCLYQSQNVHVCEIALTPDYILYIFDRKELLKIKGSFSFV